MKQKLLRPEFVDFVPDVLESGVLYVSVRYATASHKCACGCGEIVVTPIRPTDWTLQWNGETVTLDPSIGNWSTRCQSHYWIVENRIIWAKKWSISRVLTNRSEDRQTKARYYNKLRSESEASSQR